MSSRFGRETPGAAPDTGRMGFRWPGEPMDDRPTILQDWPQWRDSTEEATYEAAVHGNPKRPDETPLAYMRRISAIVTGEIGSPYHVMPKVRMSREAWERQKNDVKMRAAGEGAGE